MYYIIWAMLGLTVLYIIRAVKGPSIWDRLLALTLISAKIIIMIVAYAAAVEITFLLDFAIIYALSGFITIIFITLFLSHSKVGKTRRKKKGAKKR